MRLKEIMATDFTKPENRLTRAKAIRAKCIDCTCDQTAEIRRCPIKTCPLWPYRMGYGAPPPYEETNL